MLSTDPSQPSYKDSVPHGYYLPSLLTPTLALTRKNYLIFSRNLYVSLLLVLCPVFVCVYLNQIQRISDNFATLIQEPFPAEVSVTEIPKCPDPSCITLGIGLTSGRTEWTDFLIQHISASSNLKIGRDIKVLTETNSTSFMSYLSTHLNQTQTGVILCSNFMDLPKNRYLDKISCDDTFGNVYLMVYNYSSVSRDLFDPSLPNPIDRIALSVKLAVDNAIINYQARKRGLQEIVIELVIQFFPLPLNRFIKGLDVVSLNGALYFFIPPMFVFGLLVAEIVREKEQRLRNGLSVIGVSATAFWISWFVVAFAFSFLTANSLLLSAYLFGFDVFTRAPYLLLLLLFLVYTMTMMVIGFMLSTLITSVKLSYTISYTFLLGGLVLQCFFQSSTLLALFHIKDLPSWVPVVRFLLTFYPPFGFTKIFNDIAWRAGSMPNMHDRKWQLGPGYEWSDFFVARKGHISGLNYEIPSSFESMMDLLRNFAVFLVLTWYFDHVVAGNRGRESCAWFMFTREYWGCKKKVLGPFEIEMRDVKGRENERTYEDTIVEGLRLDGIWKQYPKSDRPAVVPLQLTIENNELVAIIGHNGAGKTTLISMLTGLLAPSGGTAYISSYDLAYDLDKIHKIVGYCPQFNILWEELTAREHLDLFARLRDISAEHRSDLITQKLEEVNLGNAADKLVGTYSGGMKRRLSVAISSIGNPRIIFMDEPTTGMDPITRREVWKLIQKLKKDRVIILTTHSMEEAEILSDRVLVMVNGEIKCNGTCLYLKNQYGDGYKVELVSKNPKGLWEFLEKEIKSLKLVDIAGGSLYVSIPRTEIDDVQKFFKIVEESKIEDWGLRNSSLEEVFIKVTGLLENL